MKTQFTQAQINDTAVSLGIPTIPFFQRRIARAYDLVETNKVNEISHDDGLYRVHSQYDDKIYTVEVNHGRPSCTCPDGKKTVLCKHHIASLLYAKQEHADRNKLVIYDDTFDKRKGMEGKRNSKYGRWIVNDHKVRKGYVVYRDKHNKLYCACGQKNCRHCKAVDKITDNGKKASESRIENECGTSKAKELQEKLNGGTGDNQSPVHHQLDVTNPFEECESRDIEQINGNGNGDLVHVLSNGEYVVSYRGIMALAEQHDVTFLRHTVKSDAKRNGTVVAYARLGTCTRASGKPMNGSFITAVELAKRNAARQLLPLPEIKALEHKAKLEAEFDWQKAKAKCLDLVPHFTLEILINDLVKEGKLRQAHSSDYDRIEWLMIYNKCKKDAETRVRSHAPGNDDGGGDNTPSSDEQVSCAICSRTLTNPESVRLQVGPECYKKVGAQGAQFLRDDEVSDELIKASKLYQDEVLQKRILRACLTLDAPAPVKVLNWLGNEYFGYRNRPILYYFCAAGQLNRLDIRVRSHAPSNRKLRHIIVTRDTAETELDAHALAQWSTQASPVRVRTQTGQKAEVPDNADEFIARCKEMEFEVDDPAPMVEVSQMNGDGKRKLVMDKNKNITLVEPDGDT